MLFPISRLAHHNAKFYVLVEFFLSIADEGHSQECFGKPGENFH